MNANNILSMARSQTDVQDLVVYVVSMAWFRKAYDLLTFHSHSANATLPYPNVTTSSYREVIGPITNVDVLVEPKSSFFTHPSLPHNINGQQPQQQKQQPLPFLAELEKQQHQYHSHQQQEQYHYHSTATAAAAAVVVAPDQKHAIDYILVGSNVWLLLGHKFGYDVAVPIHCVYCPTRRPESNNSAQNETGNFADDDDDDDWMKQPAATSPSLSCLSFPVTTTETVHMPTSGRFPYEQYLQTPPPPPPIIPQPDPVVPAAAVVTAGSEQVVSDEEDEPMSHSFRNDDDSDTGDDLVRALRFTH